MHTSVTPKNVGAASQVDLSFSRRHAQAAGRSEAPPADNVSLLQMFPNVGNQAHHFDSSQHTFAPEPSQPYRDAAAILAELCESEA